MNGIFSSFANSDVADVVANLPEGLKGVFLVILVAIVVVSIFAIGVSIYLAARYVKYNRRDDSCGLSGEEVARRVLDVNGLEDVKVSKSGSLLFGNSYSRMFKKVRLRRNTIEKRSVAAMAMGAQKAALAVLDSEGDPEMKARGRAAFLGVAGPIAFIPLLVAGAVLDILVSGGQGAFTMVACGIGMAFFALAFYFQLKTLGSERKAQDRACAILSENGMATAEEVEMLRKLFRLYNIEYVNNMVLSMLEFVYYALRFVAAVNGESGSLSTD